MFFPENGPNTTPSRLHASSVPPEWVAPAAVVAVALPVRARAARAPEAEKKGQKKRANSEVEEWSYGETTHHHLQIHIALPTLLFHIAFPNDCPHDFPPM